jgi:hypothetical protein
MHWKLEAVAKQEEEIIALKAQIRNLKKKGSGDYIGSGTSGGRSGGGSKSGKERKKSSMDAKKEKKKFPK